MANTKTVKEVTTKIKLDLESTLQKAETVQDSLTQRISRKLGKDDRMTKDAVYVLSQIRKMQFRYFPVHNHSLLRYSDGSVIRDDGTIQTDITKNNWRKYKKIKDRKKLRSFNEL